jgi:hypothetical protein
LVELNFNVMRKSGGDELLVTGKGKDQPITGHQGPRGRVKV